jgi:cyclase
VVNSIDTDGVKNGYDIELLEKVCDAVTVPVIASGGAGNAQHFVDLFTAIPQIAAALAASIFHFGEVEIKALKSMLKNKGIPMRI